MLNEALDSLKQPLRPLAKWLRQRAYEVRFRSSVSHHLKHANRAVIPCRALKPTTSTAALWNRMRAASPKRVQHRVVSLKTGAVAHGVTRYWQRYGAQYDAIGQGREKALEHALTFELFDFDRARRYCDVAAATSPIARALHTEWPGVEYWRQDLLFETDPERREIGGYAQAMDGVGAGFFDAMTLHCSFEHFEGTGDIEFVSEVDRLLSERGACLIIPLYVADTHRIYFDPAMRTSAEVSAFDAEGDVRPLFGYHQEHGRFYDPETLKDRLLAKLPQTLEATLLRFTDQDAIDSSIYLEYALVLHRAESIFGCRLAASQRLSQQAQAEP